MLTAALLLSTALGDPVELSVTSDLGELDEAVREQVTTRVENAASALDHESTDTADHKLSVHVEWAEGSTTDFLVTLQTSYQDDAAEPESFECEECSATELLDRTEAQAKLALEQLFLRTEDELEPESEPPPAPPPEPSPPPRPRRKLGGLGWGGVASLSLGVSGLAAGGVFLGLGQVRLESDPTSLRDFRPAGYAALGIGGAALVTGAVLLAVDLRRSSPDTTARRVTPSASGFQVRF